MSDQNNIIKIRDFIQQHNAEICFIDYLLIYTFRMEVQNHCVKYSAPFSFPCKMNANASTGILETCKCRISIRMVS